MHSSEVIITVVDEQFGEKRYVYDEPGVCVIGRARDCDIPLPLDPPFQAISRHHCLLEINPPSVRVHDLHSTNGTYVNGANIAAENRAPSQPAEGANAEDNDGIELHSGDEIGFAASMLRLYVQINSDHRASA